MARVDESSAQRSIESISMRLVTGHRYYHSSYGTVKEMASGLLVSSSTALELLVVDVQPEHRLLFTAGRTVVAASRFTRRALDYLGEEYEEIGPGESLVLERAAYFRDSSVANTEPEANQLYVGDFELIVAVSSLARALNEQGTITLVSAEAADEVAHHP